MHHGDRRHMVDREYRASSVRRDLYGEIKDPTKMTHAKTAPVKRGLGAKQAHANSQSAVLSWLMCS